MREIGSEFWDVPTTERDTDVFPETVQWYLSGRSALRAIIRELKGCRTVAMPSWCCGSMVSPFVDAGIEIRFYPVYFRNGLRQGIRMDCDVLFLMDYFGYMSDAPDVSTYRGIVIRDVTHSVFSAGHDDAWYYFGSLRKWCGVWTGGYAWTKDGRPLATNPDDDHGYCELRERAMNQKRAYLLGEGTENKAYLRIYEEAERCLDGVGALPAAERDVHLARKLDVETIRRRRRANAEILRADFPDWLIFPELGESDCPMFVPVLVPDGKRDALRDYLISQSIYCPIHWPVGEYCPQEEKAAALYRDELSLVCDQRYTEEDMRRVTQAIWAFWKE